MPIYQRGKSKTWWLDITTPNGERVRKSSGTKVKHEAQELHDKLKAQMWRVQNLGDKPRYTWQETVLKWLAEHDHKKSIDDDKKHLRWLRTHLDDKHLDEIDKPLLEKIKRAKINTGVSNATVNRLLALLRSILNCAKNEWEWTDNVPVIRLLPESPKRVRWLSSEEVNRLLKELPEHLDAMVRFTLATGLRESNVTQLEWSQVDLQRRCAWIYADQAKGKKSIAVPLNDSAMSVLRKQIGKHEQFVFTYDGKPVTRANNHAWRNALKRAGISDFRWHDLRHTWASWHIQNGTPVHVLKDLGGWADLTMVLRYAHLSSEYLANYAANSNHDTNSAQAIKKPCKELTRRA